MPERIIFIHIKNSRDTDSSSLCFVFGKRLVIKISFKLVFKKIGDIVLVLLLSDTALAAVARNVLASAGKSVDGKTAGVCTALALSHAGLES